MPYQKRVVDERDQLVEKLDALYRFMGEPAFIRLRIVERDLLRDQFKTMDEYLRILNQRIKLFEDPVL